MAAVADQEAARLQHLRLAGGDDDAAAAAAAVPGPSGGGGGAEATATTTTTTLPPLPRIRAFSERTPDGAAVLHYQVVDLGAQVYVWVGGGGGGPPTVTNLHFAIQQPHRTGGGEAAVAALLPEGAAGRAEPLARRLAKRVGRPVLLSLDVPGAADPLLHALAERRLLQELKDMGLVPRVAVERTGFAFDRRWMLVRTDTGRFISQREVPRMVLLRPQLLPLDAPAIGTRRASEADRNGALVVHAPSGTMPPLRVPLATATDDAAATSRSVSVWGFKGAAIDEGDEAAEWFSRALDTSPSPSGGARPRVRLVRHAPDAAGGRRAVDPSFALPDTTVGFADEFPVLAANEGSLADLNARMRAEENGSTSPPPPLPMARFRPNMVFRGGEATDAPWADDGWARVRVGGMAFEYVKPCSRCKVTTVDPDTGATSADEQPLPALRAFRSGAALGWASNRPDFRHSLFFGWNVQPVVFEDGGDGGGAATGAVCAFEGEEPLGMLERDSAVEVVARRAWL